MGYLRWDYIKTFVEGQTITKLSDESGTAHFEFASGEKLRVYPTIEHGSPIIIATPFGADGKVKQSTAIIELVDAEPTSPVKLSDGKPAPKLGALERVKGLASSALTLIKRRKISASNPPRPGSMWLVIVECRYSVVSVCVSGLGFYIPGQEPCWGFSHAQKWVKEVKLPLLDR